MPIYIIKQGKILKESGQIMGMAASQVRLLQLTSRKNTIGRSLENLSLQKNSLSRDMTRVSKNYQDALNTKTLKWTNNSGVTYVDLSYGNLMRPNTNNNNVPYLLTNESGQVVLDSKYEKYVEILEANGGKYDGDTRLEILAGLTDISKDALSNAESTSAAKTASANNINTLQAEVDKLDDKARNDRTKEADFIRKFGNTTLGNLGKDTGGSIYDWYNNTDSSGNAKKCWTLDKDATKSKAMVKEFLEGIGKTMQRYLGDSDLEKFNKAIETVTANYNNYIECAKSGNCGNTCQVSLDDSGDTKGYYVLNPNLIITELLRAYDNSNPGTDGTNKVTYYTTYDRETDAYKNYAAKKDELDKAIAEDKSVVDTDNQSLSADQESLIKFYDQIFTAIVENGYTINSNVEDSDYLNQMLQNNQYYITTMKTSDDDDSKTKYEYDSNIASNFDNIVTVNDTNAQNEAQVKYEYEKSIINEKESRIDQRMKNLETEQSAINEMIKGIESVRDKNIETNFSIFS